MPPSASSLSLLSASSTVIEVRAATVAAVTSPSSLSTPSNSRSLPSSETLTGRPSASPAIPLASSPTAGNATQK